MLKQVQHDSFVLWYREGDYPGTLRRENISKFKRQMQHLANVDFTHKTGYAGIL